jgi:hypothetical protein
MGRSRKPLWPFLAIVGSNPTLSARSDVTPYGFPRSVDPPVKNPSAVVPIALISGTYYQERLFALPDRLKEI